MKYQVKSLGLNLRSSPAVLSDNKIAVLHQGQSVTKIRPMIPPWIEIETLIDGCTVTGYVSEKYLELMKESKNIENQVIALVYLPHSERARRDVNGARAYVINEKGQPTGKDITTIIFWLNVAVSIRYRKKKNTTYCNIYACDAARLFGVYLPRVFWTIKAIQQLSQGLNIPIVYGETARELSANSLFEWLVDYGPQFGWIRIFNLERLQQMVNEGKFALISAIRTDRNQPGHISIVVPETKVHKAKRKNGKLISPLQSEAGSKNRMYHTDNWWQLNQFREFAFWVHQ